MPPAYLKYTAISRTSQTNLCGSSSGACHAVGLDMWVWYEPIKTPAIWTRLNMVQQACQVGRDRLLVAGKTL